MLAQCGLSFVIWIANSIIELFEPVIVREEWGGMIRGRVGGFDPCADVFSKDFLHERFHVQFNVVSSLHDVDAVA